MMLGVTRPTVSEVAATLQRAGCITYRRGRVTIVDRARLEAAACECYAVTAAIVDGLGSARQRPAARENEVSFRPVQAISRDGSPRLIRSAEHGVPRDNTRRLTPRRASLAPR